MAGAVGPFRVFVAGREGRGEQCVAGSWMRVRKQVVWYHAACAACMGVWGMCGCVRHVRHRVGVCGRFR